MCEMGAPTASTGDVERAEFRSLLVDLVRDDGALLTRVCRVCLRRTDDLVRLSDTCSVQIKPCAGTYTLLEILSHVTRSKVEDERVLPTGVCASCVQSCVEAFMFVRTYELNASALEKCVDVLASHADMEPHAEQERLVVSVLPHLHDYAALRDVDVSDVHLAGPAWPPAAHDCSMCERSFPSRALLRKHEAAHPPDAKHVCRHCGNMYKRRRVLARHMLERHAGADAARLLCVVCGKLFSSPYTLFCHQVVIHGAARLYYCSCCGYRGRTEPAMLRHIRLHHPRDPDAHYSVLEPNDELRAELDRAAAAAPALAGTESTRLHECASCAQAFPRAAALRRHMEREHRRLECRPCRKLFRIRSRYDTHMRLHSANPDLKVYKCDYCGYSARQRRHVVAHTTRRHTDIRPYSCGVCAKGFVKQSEVRSHMAVHTRERRETCAVCHKRFVNKAALLYHTRLHTGEKPYECAQCGERFLSASRRGAPVRSKHGPRPQCDICNSTYTNNQVLHKHIRNVHMRAAATAAPVPAPLPASS